MVEMNWKGLQTKDENGVPLDSSQNVPLTAVLVGEQFIIKLSRFRYPKDLIGLGGWSRNLNRGASSNGVKQL